MHKRRIIYSLWWIFILVFWFFTGSMLSYFLAIVTVLSSVLSFVFALFAVKELVVDVDIHSSVNKGKKKPLEISIKNNSIFPVFLGQININCTNLLTNEEVSLNPFFTLLPKGSTSINMEIGSIYCGRVKFCIDFVCCTDIAAVFCAKKRCMIDRDILIIPFEENIRISTGSNTLHAGKGNLMSDEKSGIIPYTEDMSYRLIHWKLSAKTEEILAKSNSKEGTVNTIIYIETSIPMENKGQFSYIVDERIELAYTTSKTLCNQEVCHKIVYFSQKEKIHKDIVIESMNDFINAIPVLLSLKFILDDELYYSSYSSAFYDDKLTYIAYITDEISYNQGEMENERRFIPIYREKNTEEM